MGLWGLSARAGEEWGRGLAGGRRGCFRVVGGATWVPQRLLTVSHQGEHSGTLQGGASL